MTTQTAIVLDELDHGGSVLSSPLAVNLPKAESAREDSTTCARGIAPSAQILPKTRAYIVIAQLGGIAFITSFSHGVLVVGLPAIAQALNLHENLLLWPQSVFSLTSGSCFLIAGSFADVLGARSVNLVGTFLLAAFILACGLSRTGIELIMLRAVQGLASAMTMPSSISIVATSVQSGRPRNIGFACIGLSQPLGFSFGLVLGGVFVTTVGWRVGFYICGALSFILFTIGIWALPSGIKTESENSVWSRLATEIDWIGAVLVSSALAIFSYALAMLSADVENIKKATNIALLSLSCVLAIAFVAWMRHQEKHNKPALIPNSIWKNKAFTSICIMVLLSFAMMNTMEVLSSLFFQQVQHTSALGASVRILPNLLLGLVINLTTGFLVDKTRPVYPVVISCVLCAGAPLLMALINPRWPYWYDAFFGQLLTPICPDVLFTVGILVVSDIFPVRTQALAGAVFNTLGQLGTSMGLTVVSVVSTTVSKEASSHGSAPPDALMRGFRASFWTMFAWMASACFVGAYGLRKMGKVGQKQD